MFYYQAHGLKLKPANGAGQVHGDACRIRESLSCPHILGYKTCLDVCVDMVLVEG